MNQWTDAIPWMIAAAGLGATHLLSEARERRKEVRAQLDKVIERLYALEEDGRQFHTAAAFSGHQAQLISAEIARIERLACRIARFQDDEMGPIIGHKRALTLDNFDAGSFAAQAQGGSLLNDISAATTEYEDALESQYRRRYPAVFPYFRFFPASTKELEEAAYLAWAFILGAAIGATWTFILHSRP